MFLFFFVLKSFCVFFQDGISEKIYSGTVCSGGYGGSINYVMDDYCYYNGGYSYRFETSGTTVTKYRCYGYGCSECTVYSTATFGECVSVGSMSYIFNFGKPTLNEHGYYEKVYNSYEEDCSAGFMYYTFYPNGNLYKCYNEGYITSDDMTVSKKSGGCYPSGTFDYSSPYCGGTTYACSGIDSFKSNVCSSFGNCTQNGCVCRDGFFGYDCEYECDYYECECFKSELGNSFVCNDNGKCYQVEKCDCDSDSYSPYYYCSLATMNNINKILTLVIVLLIFKLC